ncbi:hypothetical protein U1Q18_039722 [Sarracenia purpurea var. burkii]
MSAKRDFRVTVSKKEVVAAVLPMKEHWLPLSNLDLLLPPLDVGVFFCYKNPTGGEFSFTFGSMVSVLKKAMSQALVSYYPFAGEIVNNTVGEPELLCNNGGADFIEAFANIELQDLNLYNPDESIEGKLVPKKKHGVLCVQATELKCGGLVVACTFDHRVADAYSANMFLVSWAEIAQAKQLSLLPSFQRSLLNPRHPISYNSSLNDMYVTVSTPPPPSGESEPEAQLPSAADQLISRIYYIEADQLDRLQSVSTSIGSKKTTKLEAFCAFLWKIVATGEVEMDKICRIGIVVDGRTRLIDGDSDMKLMNSYFGNVLSIPFGKKSAGDLQERPMSWVADVIHEFLGSAVTKEHFLDLIDWVEVHRPEPAMVKICAGSGGDQKYGSAFVVSSGQRFPISKVDFGWGKPVFGSYHFPWGGEAGYVMPMPSPVENDDWVVYVLLFKWQVELIETLASHVFKPLTFDYLNQNAM